MDVVLKGKNSFE